MATTIKDVAKVVGVTATTVSMVMRGDTRISEPTREKVLKAAKELNYYPNQTGRSLVKGKTNIIAIASRMFYGPFKTDILNGIDYALRDSQYRTINFTARDEDECNETLKEILYGRRADAVIAINFRGDKEVSDAYKSEGKPLVYVEDTIAGEAGVAGDSEKGAYLATTELIRAGRKKIFLITGWSDKYAHVYQRIAGYKKALAENGIDFDEAKMTRSHDHSFAEGKEIYAKAKESGMDYDGVFSAAGDLVAMGFMKAAKDDGVKIPEDISIVGYDGLDSTQMTSPEMTTIQQPVFEMGKTAFQMAVDMLENNSKGELVIFEPKLIARESV